MEPTFNVIEITNGPKTGRIRVVPCRRVGFRNPLRSARYRLCNVSFDFADGFACGMLVERRVSAEERRTTVEAMS
jgi:hypothetical protein